MRALALTLLLATGCSLMPNLPPPPPPLVPAGPAAGLWLWREGACQVLTGPDGFVIIHPPASAPDARRLIDVARRLTSRRERMAVVLTADPRRRAGADALVRHGIPVVTTPAIHRALGAFEPRSGAITAAGRTFRLLPVGAAGTPAHAVVAIDDTLLVGDLVTPDRHPDLTRADLDAWMEVLDRLAVRAPRAVFPGGDAAALANQRHYLETVRAVVAEAAASDETPELAARRAFDRLVGRWPNRRGRTWLGTTLPALIRARRAEPAPP